jgi:hypothetical protein
VHQCPGREYSSGRQSPPGHWHPPRSCRYRRGRQPGVGELVEAVRIAGDQGHSVASLGKAASQRLPEARAGADQEQVAAAVDRALSALVYSALSYARVVCVCVRDAHSAFRINEIESWLQSALTVCSQIFRCHQGCAGGQL